jgi:hypothetical protein
VIKNAVIESAEISYGERGFLDAWLTLDYGGSGQGFGGYVLYMPKSYRNHRLSSPAGHFIFRVMEIAGVTEWSKLKGKTIRVRTDSDSEFGGLIEAVGHIVREDWFSPSEDFKALGNDTKEVAA